VWVEAHPHPKLQQYHPLVRLRIIPGDDSCFVKNGTIAIVATNLFRLAYTFAKGSGWRINHFNNSPKNSDAQERPVKVKHPVFGHVKAY
jgi:hypothetical protein